jgi:hypothetical protein
VLRLNPVKLARAVGFTNGPRSLPGKIGMKHHLRTRANLSPPSLPAGCNSAVRIADASAQFLQKPLEVRRGGHGGHHAHPPAFTPWQSHSDHVRLEIRLAMITW